MYWYAEAAALQHGRMKQEEGCREAMRRTQASQRVESIQVGDGRELSIVLDKSMAGTAAQGDVQQGNPSSTRGGHEVVIRVIQRGFRGSKEAQRVNGRRGAVLSSGAYRPVSEVSEVRLLTVKLLHVVESMSLRAGRGLVRTTFCGYEHERRMRT